jgi:uncharacterized protein (TIGR02246 family)
MDASFHDEVNALYQKLINAWNNRDAQGMADQYTEQGVQIGFDGSKVIGCEEIFYIFTLSLNTILQPPI